MALFWGVIPVLDESTGSENPNEIARRWAESLGLAEVNNSVVMVRGFHDDPALNTPSITVVNPAHSLVSAMTKELDMLSLRNTQAKPEIDFFVSGDPAQFAEASGRLVGFTPEVKSVSLAVLEGRAIAQSV